MIESIKTICVTKPIDTCSKCEKLCKGDYWHKDMTIYLCQPCWNEEKLTREIYDEKGLKQFKVCQSIFIIMMTGWVLMKIATFPSKSGLILSVVNIKVNIFYPIQRVGLPLVTVRIS